MYRCVLFGGVNRYTYRLCPSVCTKKSAPIFMHTIVFCDSVCCALLFLCSLIFFFAVASIKSHTQFTEIEIENSTTTRLPATICWQRRAHTDF